MFNKPLQQKYEGQPEPNRPFPSSKKFHFQNEAKCETFVVEMSFICIISESESETFWNSEMAYYRYTSIPSVFSLAKKLNLFLKHRPRHGSVMC